MWLNRLPLKTRIGLGTILGLGSLLAFVVFEGMVAMETATEMTLKERLNLGHTIAFHIDHELERTMDRLSQVAILPSINLEDKNLEPEKAELRRLYRSQLFKYVFFLNRDSLVLWTEPYLTGVVGRGRLDCPHAKECLRTGQPSIACVLHSLTPESLVISLVAPIRNRKGVIVGLLGGAIDPSSSAFSRVLRLKEIPPGKTGYTQIVDENGIVLAHTEDRNLFQRSEHADSFIPLIKEKRSNVFVETVTEKGKGTFREVIAFAHLTVAPWGVAVEQEENELLAPARNLKKRIFLFGFAVFFGSLILVWVIGRSIVNPLERLKNASSRIASGDLTAPIPELGKDEIGRLGVAFEHMRQKLARWGDEMETQVREKTKALQISNLFLEIANRHTELTPLLNVFVTEIQNLTGCAAVGIRLLDEAGNIPYQAFKGFSQEFYEKESPLSIHFDRCMCINVIKGTTDLSLPFYTPGGSFYINATTRFLETVTEEEKGRTRNECNRQGFESVALIPIRLGKRILGMIHIADPREDMVPLDKVEILERIAQQLGGAIERIRSEERSRRHYEEISTLYSILRTTARSRELTEVLNNALRAALEAMATDSGGIYLLEPDGEEMRVCVSQGHSEEFVKNVRTIRLGEGVSGRAAKERKPMVFDVSNYPTERLTPFIIEEELKTIASIPLLSGEKLMGVMNLSTRKSRSFSESEMELLEAIGRELGQVIEKVRLYEKERYLVNYLEKLNQAISQASAILDMDALASFITEVMVKEFQSAFARLWIVDATGENLVLKGSAGLSSRLDGDRSRVAIATDPKKLGIIARERRPIISNRAQQEPYFDRAWAEKEGLVAFAGYPIVMEGRLLGVLAIFSRQPLSGEIQDVLGAFVNQAAIAIQNVQLYQNIFESEEKYRSLFENSKDVVYISSKEGFFIDINPSAVELFGYSREELLSTPIKNLYVEPSKRVEDMEAIERLNFVKDYPLNFKRKDGKVLNTLVSSVAQRDREGNIIGYQGILRDITEQKRAEEERKTLEGQLYQSQKMEAIGQLTGGIAHDFNNLLTIISGNAQLSLLDLREGDPLKTSIEEIRKASERAADLTRQLLAFSRKQILEMKVLDLNQVLQRLDKMLRRVIGEDIALEVIPMEPIGKVKADPGQMEQVIMNLAVNARDAMPEGGNLTIETANVELDEEYARKHIAVEPGRYVMLSVSDTGVGMTPEVKERIFEPFFTTKEMGKGTGLGLSTVYGIVKQSGGNIWVYSEPGEGTTFKIYLPQVDEPLEELKEEVIREIPQGSETVLVVEDDETVRQLAIRILKKQGYKVLEASEGREALLLCEEFKEPIHLILTDVVMPGMSGRILAERLKEIHPEANALYMSGYTNNTILHHGVLEPGINFIQKPFTIDGLAPKQV